MSRLIDAGKLHDEIKLLHIYVSGKDIFPEEAKDIILDCIANAYTEDVQEVKRGKWVNNGWGDYIKICSCCGRSPLSKQNGKPYYSKFCPFCGTEMDSK